MMNILALSLVLTTLLTASVHSPPPPVKNQEDVIVKEGHRVVKVEFDEGGENTKVSFSSHDHGHGHFGLKDKISGVVGDAKEKLKDASNAMPNLGQGAMYDDESGGNDDGYGERATARELICDAFGKCKHKIASALGRTKGVVSDKVQEATDKMYEVDQDAKETVSDAMGRVKDSVGHRAYQASDMAKDAAAKTKSRMEDGAEMAKDSMSQKAKQASELAGDAAAKTKARMEDAAEMAKDSVSQKAKQASELAGDAARYTKSRIEGRAKEAAEMAKQGMKETAEMAKQKAQRGKEAVEEAIDTGKTLKGEVERNAFIEDISEKMKHGAEEVEGEGKKGVETMRRRARGLWHSTLDSLRSYMRILQLFGFATAYGMSMWVTFLSSYVLARILPRQQFANAQSKIYPAYFKAMAYSVGLALLGHLISEGKIREFASMGNFQGLNLITSLGMILANLLYFEPLATKVMFERMKWEKEEGRGVPAATTVTTTKATEASNIRMVGSAVSPTTGTTTVPPPPPTEASAAQPPMAASGSDARPLKIIELSEALKKLNSYSSFLNVLTLMGLTLHLVHLGQRLSTAC
ncbi:hypothetical protein Leryth_018119 [Lithospermum erythrorhizon]|nr:hypothetical protein Leryth_018119 [Lithospermum erythrorhizon]